MIASGEPLTQELRLHFAFLRARLIYNHYLHDTGVSDEDIGRHLGIQALQAKVERECFPTTKEPLQA